MISIHKEGFKFLFIVALIIIILAIVTSSLYIIIPGILLFIFFMSFFRKPKRLFEINDNILYSPADGKVVVIEETIEDEYFKDKRLQVSIFMSVWNIHINWYAISGILKYVKYHPGKYLVARNPKASTDNERTTVVIETKSKVQILFRQIAGFVARRVVCYAKEGFEVKQGNELGFIKFGSRVDVLLPVGTKLNIELNQKVRGNKTIIANLN